MCHIDLNQSVECNEFCCRKTVNLSRPLPSMDVGDTWETTATMGDTQANGVSDKWGYIIRANGFETLRSD